MATKKPKQLSYGIIRFMESKEGNLVLDVDVKISPDTDHVLVTKIRSIVAGINYTYENDPDAIEQLGLAFIRGVEIGLKANEPDETKPKIGFHAP